MLSPAEVVQAQLDAYNDRDIERFVACYSEQVEVFRPPTSTPVLQGLSALREHYQKNRFTLPNLHARLVNRMVSANIVVDHEAITGLHDQELSAVAVYQVEAGLIQRVWFY